MSTDRATAAYSAITTQLESWLTITTSSPNNLTTNNQLTTTDDEDVVEKQYKSLEIFLKKRSLSYDIITSKRIDVEYLNECEELACSYDECDLWRLIRLLRVEGIDYLCDTTCNVKHDDLIKDSKLDIYASGDDIIKTILSNDKVYHRRCILLKWIQSSLDKKLSWNIFPPSSHNTMWPYTMEEIKKDKKTLELDGFVLVDKKDVRREEELTNCIWCCIQAGNMEKAKDVCVNTGQAWRAASYDIDRNRDEYFLKKLNYNLASKAIDDPHEKYVLYEIAIYGLLGNNPRGCLACCNTWQKAIQVYLYCMVQRLEDEVLSKFNHRVRSMSTMFPAKTTYPEAEVQLLQSTKDLKTLTELDMFRELAKRYKVNDVQALQSCIAVGTISVLDFITSYQERDGVSPSIMAHFVIFYDTLIPNTVPQETYKNIVLNYIQTVLIPTDSYWPYVALYTSLLPDNQVVMNTYASFLLNIQDMQHRSIVLQKAREHLPDGMDLLILTQVVNQIFNDNVNIDTSGDNTIHPTILNKMQAVLWFTFYPDHHIYALQYANLFLKTCILQNQIYPCQVFLQEYFSSFQTTMQNHNSIFQEHECMRIYVVAITEYENFIYCLEKFEKDKTNSLNYTTLSRTATVTEQQLMKIIQYPSGWMSFSAGEQQSDNVLLQRKCLPHVVNMIHTVCSTFSKYCKDESEKLTWLHKAVKLITFVASEDYGLFEFFDKVELEKVLGNALESYVVYLRFSGN